MNGFGKRHPKPNKNFLNKSRTDDFLAFFGGILKFVFLVIIALLIIAALRSPHFEPAVVLAMGMLGDPWRTTRKMKVPYHSRKGHRERKFDAFATFILVLVALGLLAGVAWEALHVAALHP